MSVRVRSFGLGCLRGGLGRTPPRMSVNVRSSGLGCLRGGLGHTLPRLHGRVRSSGHGCLRRGLGLTLPRLSGRVRSSGFGCLGGGLGRTPLRLHGRVRSSGRGCLRGGLGRTLLTTSSGFTVADNLGLVISQSRAVSPLFGCVACTFLGRAWYTQAQIQTLNGGCGGTAQWERKLHDREVWDTGFRVKSN
jgi:hypothetical protein